jgi:hypothetical protein
MSTHADRLAALRAQLQAQGLDGFIIPLTDEHMSEYVGAYARRLEWLTGFQGSAGSAAVLADSPASAGSARGAAIFIDGRYTIQVRAQVDGSLYEYRWPKTPRQAGASAMIPGSPPAPSSNRQLPRWPRPAPPSCPSRRTRSM